MVRCATPLGLYAALDIGDISMVFGPEIRDMLPDYEWLNRTKLWLWQRGRGYLPLNEREKVVRAHLEGRAARG